MTKAQMAKRIKELEDQLGIVTKPTKIQEIEALETETMVKVLDLIKACEKITGRTLGTVKNVHIGFSKKMQESDTPLRSMVEEMTALAMDSGYYTFANTRCFADWVHKKILEG